MKIFYWSPFISKVATTSSVIRSAESIVKYSKKENNVNLAIIDAVGEWEDYKKLIDPKIEIINLNKKKILEYLPKGSFFKSRLSYVLIFCFSFCTIPEITIFWFSVKLFFNPKNNPVSISILYSLHINFQPSLFRSI